MLDMDNSFLTGTVNIQKHMNDILSSAVWVISFKDLIIEVAINSRMSAVILFKIINMIGNSRKNALEIMAQLLDEPVSSPWQVISLETAIQCKILVGVGDGSKIQTWQENIQKEKY